MGQACRCYLSIHFQGTGKDLVNYFSNRDRINLKFWSRPSPLFSLLATSHFNHFLPLPRWRLRKRVSKHNLHPVETQRLENHKWPSHNLWLGLWLWANGHNSASCESQRVISAGLWEIKMGRVGERRACLCGYRQGMPGFMPIQTHSVMGKHWCKMPTGLSSNSTESTCLSFLFGKDPQMAVGWCWYFGLC